MRRGRDDPAFAEAVRLINEAKGASWYEEANAIDAAITILCMLRRDESDIQRAAAAGDSVVRDVLETADPEAVVWLATRVISYMDENEFPELVSRGRRVQMRPAAPGGSA